MIMPFGTYTTPKRFTGLAEVLARAESAGTMLSMSGSASVAPMPRRTVRRGMAFLAMNIRHSLALHLRDLPDPPRLRSRVVRRALRRASPTYRPHPTYPTYPTHSTHPTYPTYLAVLMLNGVLLTMPPMIDDQR